MREFEFIYNTAEEALPDGSDPESEYHSTFNMMEKDVMIEHTIPLGNLLLHTSEGRIVGIEIFERANEILGTWEELDEWAEDVVPIGGRWFMKKGSGVYSNRSKAEIVAEDEGCDECGSESFEEERVDLNREKELVIDVCCTECGWVHDTVKR